MCKECTSVLRQAFLHEGQFIALKIQSILKEMTSALMDN